MSESEKNTDSAVDIPAGLKGSDRKYLRGLAHTLTPVVRIGNAGLTDRVVEATEQALDAHELIKVKIAADRDERKAAKHGAHRPMRISPMGPARTRPWRRLAA